MSSSLKYCLIIVILLSVFSCNILKSGKKTDNNDSKFTFLFSEANKNRLLGNNKKAIEFYLAAIEIKPASAASNFYLSTIFLSNKEYKTALNFADNAVKLQADNRWYNLARADILSNLNKTKEAADICNMLIKKYPKTELFYDRLIKIYSREKDLSNLLYTYEIKMKNFEYDNNSALNLYDLCLKTGNKKKANEILHEIVLNNPDDPKFKTLLAEFWLTSREPDKSEALYIELLEEYPNDSEVKLSYTYFCKYTKKDKEYYTNSMDLMSSDIDISKKVSLLISGQYPNFPDKQFFSLLTELYRHHSEDVIVNSLFAEYYLGKDNKEEAIKYVRKATRLSKSDYNLVLTLFELSYDADKFQDLFNDSEEYLSIYPNKPKVYLYNGIAAFKLNRYDTTITVLESGSDLVIEDNELLTQFYYYIAESYHKLNNNLKSDQYFEKIIELDTKFCPALISYSVYLSNRGTDIEKAETLARSCLNSKNNKAIYFHAYALALYKGKKYKEALLYSEKYVNESTKNAIYLELHGDISFSNDNKEEALKFWKLSKKMSSKNLGLDFKINNIDKLELEEL